MFQKSLPYYLTLIFLAASSLKASALPCKADYFATLHLASAGDGGDGGDGGGNFEFGEAAVALREQLYGSLSDQFGDSYDERIIIKKYRHILERFSSLENPRSLALWLQVVIKEPLTIRKKIIHEAVLDIQFPTDNMSFQIDDLVGAIRNLPDEALDRFPFSALPNKEARIILSELPDNKLLALIGLETPLPTAQDSTSSTKPVEKPDLPFQMLKEKLQGTSPGQLNRTYESAAKKWHPNHNSTPEASERYKKITVAYKTLHETLYRLRQ